MNKQLVVIYTPQSPYKQGLGNIIRGIVRNIISSRELIWQLFLRNLKARYKQSLLGWSWIFLMPIITMGTFLLLNISGIIKIGEIPVPYPIFGLLSFSLWQIFSNGLPVLARAISAGGSLITQINFPREALLFADIASVMVDFLIRLGLVLIVYLFYGLSPSIWILLLPFYLLPILCLTLGLGFLTAILDVLVRDTKNFIDVGMGFLIFLMPIMYTMPEKGILAKVNQYNPIYFLVGVPRNLIIFGHVEYWQQFLISSLGALLIFFIGWFVFYLVQPKLAERI